MDVKEDVELIPIESLHVTTYKFNSGQENCFG